ncbi:MAG: hypothetical protein DRN30_04965 [Thermoplasmata archaeon]|nr:MAG: hypothetical protein DRN30_04965 [Thermoplasmata archaeon]
MKKLILDLIDTIRNINKCGPCEALETLICLKTLMDSNKLETIEGTPEFVLINLIEGDFLEKIRAIDFQELFEAYKWELTKLLKKFETEELLSEHVWIRVLEILSSSEIKSITIYTDSPAIAVILSKILKERIKLIIQPIRAESSILLKKTLHVLSSDFKDIKHSTPKSILLVPVKPSKKDIESLVDFIKTRTQVGSLVVLIIPKRLLLSRKGFLSYITLGDCTFLSIISSTFIGEKLVMIVTVRSLCKFEPFPIENKIGIVRYNTPLVFDPSNIAHVDSFWGVNPYNVQEGLITGKDEAYVVMILEDNRTLGLPYVSTLSRYSLGFRNAGFVEKDLLYPVVRFSDLRWPKTIPEYWILLPVKGQNILDEKTLKEKYPNTYAFFIREKEKLISRKIKYYQASQEVPFYYVNVNPQALAPYKVAWKSIGKEFYVSFVEPFKGKPTILLSGIQYIPIYDKEEALYLFAFLNSSIIREILAGNEYNNKISIKLIKSLKLPKYNKNDELHRKLVLLASKMIGQWEKEKNVSENILSEVDNVVKKIVRKDIMG